ncbi:MAG: hypothetical protein OXU20_30655 [Myxococcales bacterium]|nr:hypothetical protein [Myxococcales bacterium]MDD9965221.1 hypothetical protein [Myxococcales bacterium]
MRLGVGELALIAMVLVVVFMVRMDGSARKGGRSAMRRRAEKRRWRWLALALLVTTALAVQQLLSAR